MDFPHCDVGDTLFRECQAVRCQQGYNAAPKKGATLLLHQGGPLESGRQRPTYVSKQVLVRMSTETAGAPVKILTPWLRAVEQLTDIVRIVALMTDYAYTETYLRRLGPPWIRAGCRFPSYSPWGNRTMRWPLVELGRLPAVHSLKRGVGLRWQRRVCWWSL